MVVLIKTYIFAVSTIKQKHYVRKKNQFEKFPNDRIV